MQQLGFDFITTKEEETEYIRLLLIGYDLLKDFADCEKDLGYINKRVKALRDGIKDCESDIQEYSQPDNKPIIIRNYLIRTACKLQIELWNRKLLPLRDYENKLLSEMELISLNMRNKAITVFNQTLDTIRLSKGKEPKAFTGLSVVEG